MTRVALKFNDAELKALDTRVGAAESTRYSYCMNLVRADIQGELIGKEKSASPPKNKKVKAVGRTVYLDNFVLKEAKFRAKQRSMSLSAYVAGIVQAQVTQTTILRHNELIGVLDARRELSAIGRNLNQIARHLNERYTETDRLKLEHLDALKAAIEQQQTAILEMVKASRRSWGMVDE